MRKTMSLWLGFLFACCSYAQPYRDSLRSIITSTRIDTTKVNTLNNLSQTFLNNNYDSVFHYAQQAIELANKINYERGVAEPYIAIAEVFRLRNNQTRALEYVYKAIAIGEKHKMTWTLAMGHNVLAHVFALQNNYQASLKHYREGYEILQRDSTSAIGDKILMVSNVAHAYLQLNMPDSALHFYTSAYQMARSNSENLTQPLHGLGQTHFKLKNPELGKTFCLMALQTVTDQRSKANIYFTLGDHFLETGNNDSAYYYISKSKNLNQQLAVSRKLPDTYVALITLFRNLGRTDSVIYYQDKLLAYKDTIDRQNNISQIQNLQFEQELKQMEKAQADLEERKARAQNLQYAAIAFIVISFLILLFVFSHSVIASPGLIKFLGILSLLIVFEFINLLIHPYLDKWTDHSIPMMLGIMVCIAALLIPLHHKLEHWITNKLVEKNKKIRLAAAKKTIAQLEGEPTN